MSGHKPWREIKHKSHELELMRLSATTYKGLPEEENPKLTKLKEHFGSLDDENDEVDLDEVKYYGKPVSDAVFNSVLFVFALLFVYAVLRSYGVL